MMKALVVILLIPTMVVNLLAAGNVHDTTAGSVKDTLSAKPPYVLVKADT